MPLEKFITCALCGAKTPPNQVRANPEATDWICLKCYESHHRKNKKVNLLVPSATVKKESQETRITNVKSEPLQNFKTVKEKYISPLKITVKCIKCAYSFIAYPESLKRVCPSCGRNGTLRQLPSTSSILKEIEDEERFIKRDKFF